MLGSYWKCIWIFIFTRSCCYHKTLSKEINQRQLNSSDKKKCFLLAFSTYSYSGWVASWKRLVHKTSILFWLWKEGDMVLQVNLQLLFKRLRIWTSRKYLEHIMTWTIHQYDIIRMIYCTKTSMLLFRIKFSTEVVNFTRRQSDEAFKDICKIMRAKTQ